MGFNSSINCHLQNFGILQKNMVERYFFISYNWLNMQLVLIWLRKESITYATETPTKHPVPHDR